MRRLEHLINDIRFNSNQVDSNRFSDIRLHKLFNDAQKQIQAIIFMSDVDSSIFEVDYYMNMVADQESYSLPTDIYSVSSISGVGIAPNNISSNTSYKYTQLSKISNKERRSQLGYIIKNKAVLISPIPRESVTNGILLTYIQKVADLSIRIGKIQAFVSGASITLAAGFSTETIENYADHVTVVDSDGVIKQSGINLNAYAAGVITTDTALTGIAINDYVVLGKYATSHSELPEETEPLLTAFVERKIDAINSSIDLPNSQVFTQEEKDLVIQLFSDKDNDVQYPPITDSTYINN